MGKIVKVTRYPKCDFCDNEAHYDARTRVGVWAYLCEEHFKVYGTGRLGTGYGQKFVREED